MKIDEISTSKTIIKHSKSVIDDKLNVPDDCPMPNKCSVIVVSGAMGSGKSAFLSSMFCSKGNGRIYNNTFEHIHYVTPLETFESEENHPFKTTIKVGYITNLLLVFSIRLPRMLLKSNTKKETLH